MRHRVRQLQISIPSFSYLLETKDHGPVLFDIGGGICSAWYWRGAALRNKERRPLELEEKSPRRPACLLLAQRNRSRECASNLRMRRGQRFARGSYSLRRAEFRRL